MTAEHVKDSVNVTCVANRRISAEVRRSDRCNACAGTRMTAGACKGFCECHLRGDSGIAKYEGLSCFAPTSLRLDVTDQLLGDRLFDSLATASLESHAAVPCSIRSSSTAPLGTASSISDLSWFRIGLPPSRCSERGIFSWPDGGLGRPDKIRQLPGGDKAVVHWRTVVPLGHGVCPLGHGVVCSADGNGRMARGS